MPAKRKIIIDTDPGQDDAVAILLALASPEIDVLGLTAVAGNVPLHLTQKNAMKICELAGRPETKVFAGAVHPMMRHLVTAEHVHGRTGLNGPDLPEPTMKLQEKHAVDFIIETLHARAAGDGDALRARAAHQHRAGDDARAAYRSAHPGDRADGRRLLRGRQHHPRRRVQHLCRSARRRHRAEIRRADRHDAARRHTQGADDAQAHRRFPRHWARASASRRRSCWSSSSASTRRNTAPMAARCTIPASSPICSSRNCSRAGCINVSVETTSELTMGMTVADWWGVTNRDKNVTYMRDIDHDRLLRAAGGAVGQLKD